MANLKEYAIGFVGTSLILGLATITVGGIGTHTVKLLQAATAQQCATQDWPTHQHEAHVAFCVSEGYSVGSQAN